MKKETKKKSINKPTQKKSAKNPRKTAAQKKWAEICEGLDDHPWMPNL